MMTQDASEAEDDVITHFALIQLSVLLLNKAKLVNGISHTC